MYYIPIKLSELPLWRLSKDLKIVSVNGVMGTVEEVEYTTRHFRLSIRWDNGAISVQDAENLTQVYALVYDAGVNKRQREAINQFNSK